MHFFRGSIGTKSVRSPAGHSLVLSSPTSKLSMLAPAGISIQSQAASVKLQALGDVTLRARGHNSQVIRIEFLNFQSF